LTASLVLPRPRLSGAATCVCSSHRFAALRFPARGVCAGSAGAPVDGEPGLAAPALVGRGDVRLFLAPLRFAALSCSGGVRRLRRRTC